MQYKIRHSGNGMFMATNGNILDEMKAYTATINLTADTEYDLTTTIGDTRQIYNVLPDYSGEDARITVTWATSGGVWHVYLWSPDTLAGVNVKIIYK